MQDTRQTPILRADGTIDTTRAMAHGHDARSEALRKGVSRLAAWLRRRPIGRRAVLPVRR